MTDNTEQDDFNLAEMPDDKLKSLAGKAMFELKKRAAKKRDEKPPSEMSDSEYADYRDKRVSNNRG